MSTSLTHSLKYKRKKKMTQKEDDAYDKKHGQKEGSKADVAQDRRSGIKDKKHKVVGAVNLIKKGGDYGYMSPQARATSRTGGLTNVPKSSPKILNTRPYRLAKKKSVLQQMKMCKQGSGKRYKIFKQYLSKRSK